MVGGPAGGGPGGGRRRSLAARTRGGSTLCLELGGEHACTVQQGLGGRVCAGSSALPRCAWRRRRRAPSSAPPPALQEQQQLDGDGSLAVRGTRRAGMRRVLAADDADKEDKQDKEKEREEAVGSDEPVLTQETEEQPAGEEQGAVDAAAPAGDFEIQQGMFPLLGQVRLWPLALACVLLSAVSALHYTVPVQQKRRCPGRLLYSSLLMACPAALAAYSPAASLCRLPPAASRCRDYCPG